MVVLTYNKKIKHSMFCGTDVHLSDRTNTFFFNFALECKLSEQLKDGLKSVFSPDIILSG